MPGFTPRGLLCLAVTVAVASCTAARARTYVVRGRIVDAERPVPVAQAQVAWLPSGPETASDTAGAFEIRTQAKPGCYLLRIRQIGYGITARSVPLGDLEIIDVGDVRVRPAPLLEWRLLYLEQCALPDSIRVVGTWGVDTIPVIPALPNLPGDSTFTVARPGVPRTETLYYRNIVGIIVDDTTSGATIRTVLARYHGNIIGGVPGDREYIVQIPDPGPTFDSLEALVLRLNRERGVRLARQIYYRWKPIIDGP